MNNSYGNFARVYERVMNDTVSYDEVYKKYEGLLPEFRGKNSILLDLGCGTGNMSVRFAEGGYDVIGVDGSDECLSAAYEKSEGLDIRYIKQDIRRLDLYGTVNVTIAAFDVINHLETPNDIRACFEKVALFTEPGGVFLFDYNTIYKHREILANNIYNFDYGVFFCSWENISDGNRVNMKITVFERAGNNYTRFDESFTETAFEPEEIKKLLEDCGFEVNITDFDTGRTPTAKTKRLLFFAHKR
jgi:ubiquinone/menaquinone biosynthesis C-methylase UbiE